MRTALALALLSLSLLAADGKTLPNILVILVDDMGYGDLKSFNPDSKIPTPNLEKLAREGMRFTDAHAPGPLCHLSRYGLMTGRYPFRANTGAWRTKASIKKGQTTIASLLRGKGYRTAMVGKWHLGFDENGYDKPLPGGPVDVGFETFFGIRASTDIPPYFYIRGNRAVSEPSARIASNYSDGWSRIQGAFWRAGGISPGLRLKDVLPLFTEEAVKVIQTHEVTAAKPLFLYLAYPAPHTPWLPSEKFKGTSGAGMYGDFTAMVDDEIGRILQALELRNLTANTLVIFTSDNGPVWYEDDVRRFAHEASGGLRGMKADAWEGGHRMPFLLRWPGVVEGGQATSHLVCFTDLLATFSEITSSPLPDDQSFDSESFLSILRDPLSPHPPRGPIVMQAGSGAMMIRDGDWKLIDQLGSGGFSAPKRLKPGPGDPEGQLYNLAADPSEKSNLWDKHPEIVRKLGARMRKIAR